MTTNNESNNTPDRWRRANCCCMKSARCCCCNCICSSIGVIIGVITVSLAGISGIRNVLESLARQIFNERDRNNFTRSRQQSSTTPLCYTTEWQLKRRLQFQFPAEEPTSKKHPPPRARQERWRGRTRTDWRTWPPSHTWLYHPPASIRYGITSQQVGIPRARCAKSRMSRVCILL